MRPLSWPLALLGLTSWSGTLAASPPFTAAQGGAGQTVYTQHCQNCHGATLQGSAGPALAGAAFMKRWSGKKLGDLHYIVHSQMPLSAPGSLSDTQYLNVIAYILQRNGFKAGPKPLSAAALKSAAITK